MLNEEADRLANAAATAWKAGATPSAGPGFPGGVTRHPEAAAPAPVYDDADLFSGLSRHRFVAPASGPNVAPRNVEDAARWL